MLPADVSFRHDQETLAFRDGETGKFRDPGCRARDGRRGAVTLVVPENGLQFDFLLRRNEITALFLQLGEEGVVNRSFHNEVAVGRAARTVVGDLTDAGVSGGV